MENLVKTIIRSYPLLWPRIYAYIRARLLSMKEIEKALPEKGKILDVGCGYGITSIYFALKSIKRQVVGSELSRQRVITARRISREIPNLRFEAKNLIESDEKFDAIVAIDLLHHISNRKKEVLVKECRKRLNKNGILIIKDIDKKPRHKYAWNYVHDKLMTRDRLYFYSSRQIKLMLEKNKFKIKEYKRIKSRFYPHVLFVCSC